MIRPARTHKKWAHLDRKLLSIGPCACRQQKIGELSKRHLGSSLAALLKGLMILSKSLAPLLLVRDMEFRFRQPGSICGSCQPQRGEQKRGMETKSYPLALSNSLPRTGEVVARRLRKYTRAEARLRAGG